MQNLTKIPGLRSLLMAAIVALAMAGCGDDDPAAPVATVDVDVFFAVNVAGQPLILNQISYANDAGTAYSIKELRFVLSNITLHNAAGGSVKIKDMHYFDVASAATQTFSFTGSVPHEDWTSVSFTFGLDETRNLRNRYQSMTTFHQVMQWPTTLGAELGYHYMQLEGNFEVSPGVTSGYTTHLGARQLDGTNPDYPGVEDAAPHHHHYSVELPITPTHIHEGGHGELVLAFDLNGLYRDHTPLDGVDTSYDFKDFPEQVIMGDLDVQSRFQTNGPFCFSATMEAHGGTHH